MNYYEIGKAIRNYNLYAFSFGGSYVDIRGNTTFEAANFESIICNYVTALEELGKVRDENKRACLYYVAIGFYQDQIAFRLNISERQVRRYMRWLKNFFKPKEENEKISKNKSTNN